MAFNPLYKTKSKTSIRAILTTKRTRGHQAQTVSHFTLSHPKRIPLIGNPVKDFATDHGKPEYNHHGTHQDGEHHSQHDHDDHHDHSHLVDDELPLHRNHESSVIQLFYDLFFVANLTTFTGVHEVNDVETLKSYIGFFALLWFTWFQVAIFDIRFGVDSVVERICKALQFGVMTGFAVVGPAFQVGFAPEDKEASQATQAFKTLAIILMVSRLILAFQYVMVIFFARRWKKAILPLALHVLVLVISAFVFLGTSFSFTANNGSVPLVGWYVLIGLEAGSILLISGLYKFLSFRKTCVVERLGLLTLIILGEGVIGLCSSVQKIGNSQSWTPDIIGMIICSVLIIYTMWMLYFDQAETNAVGTLRQQAWTLCHFPYHLGILFLVEGCSQLTIWRQVINTWLDLQNNIFNITIPGGDDESFAAYGEAIGQTVEQFYTAFESGRGELRFPPDKALLAQIVTNITDIPQDYGSGNVTNLQEIASEYASDAWVSAAVFASNNIGFEAPIKVSEANADASTILESLFNDTLTTVIFYFFVASTMALGMTAVLMMLGKRRKILGDWLNITFRFVIITGMIITFSVMSANILAPYYSGLDFTVYLVGPWMLPTIAIIFLVTVIVDHVLRNWTHSVVTKRNRDVEIGVAR